MIPGLAPLIVTAKLAAVTTIILLIIGTPIAWWLAFTRNRARPLIEALVALPLVLPPTVLGFYLLLAMSPHGWLGGFWSELTGQGLAFTFTGLVIASILYSLPFVVQPLVTSFSNLGTRTLETAATLGASRFTTFWTVVLPQSRRGFVAAAVLAFAHTVGEFGVVLMVGGNIPGVTRVASIAVYDHVESLNMAQAHGLSGLLLGFSFAVLILVYGYLNRQRSLIQ